MKKVLLIGTKFTMMNNFYSKSFSKEGIDIIVPKPAEQDIIHNIIFPELEAEIVISEKKINLINICDAIIKSKKLDGIILGCTELLLMIKSGYFDVQILDASEIHIEKITNMLIS